MEILTLLKANIRRKKGTFLSILLLTAIIVTVTTTVFSVQDNYNSALDNAMTYADCGEVNAGIRTDKLTDKTRQSIEQSELVARVDYLQGICTNGTTIGEYSDNNAYFMMEMTDKIKLFNAKEDDFETSVPALQEGEVYLPLGLKYKLQCDVGDTVHVDLIEDQSAEFTIKGFVQEPSLGSMMIGFKYIFISHADFEAIYAQCKPFETDDMYSDITIVQIHQGEDSTLSVAQFQRQLNQETKIVDLSWATLNQAQSLQYSTLLPDMLLDVVLVFAIFLFVTVLIVMSHSIGTEIEIDYTTLGVLKAQGFSKGKIRVLILMQYVIAEVLGIFVGCFAAIPIERSISSICQYVTAVLPEKNISIGKALLFAVIMLLASILLIWVKTRKVAAISPVRAISEGREEIFFDSHLNLPIQKKCLSGSLSLRQFTSAKKRYLGTILITAILTFCMVTINLTGIMLSSRTALDSMGMTIPDINVTLLDSDNSCDLDAIDDIVMSHTEIKKKNCEFFQYMSVNGENLHCNIIENPEYTCILKGRAAIYDNEILITEMVADTLDIHMGDEVTVTVGEEEEHYLISGIFQVTNDAGMVFAMNFEGAQRLNIDTKKNYRYYLIADETKAQAIADEIKETYGEDISVEVYHEDTYSEMQLFNMIVMSLKIVIYAFSILFAFVVVRIVCSKAFIQERTDIGIYKAIGFTSNRLRLGFAIRFLIVAVIGSLLGMLLSILFSAKILSLLFSFMGISRVMLEYTAISVLVPIGAICLSCFVFAFFTSRKIKKVAVRELVVE